MANRPRASRRHRAPKARFGSNGIARYVAMPAVSCSKIAEVRTRLRRRARARGAIRQRPVARWRPRRHGRRTRRARAGTGCGLGGGEGFEPSSDPEARRHGFRDIHQHAYLQGLSARAPVCVRHCTAPTRFAAMSLLRRLRAGARAEECADCDGRSLPAAEERERSSAAPLGQRITVSVAETELPL